jgi:tripartite motif-containing protein 71
LWTVGTRGSGNSQFIKPWGLAYDGTHSPARVLVADTGNSRIVALSASTGTWNGALNIAKGTANGQITAPQGLTVDATGNIWVADTGNDRIEEFTSLGAFANQMLGSYGLSGNAVFNAPQGMAFDAGSGLLYVADTNNNRIQVFRPFQTGPPTFQRTIFNAGGVAPFYPAGGEADSAGTMFLADSGGSRIDKVDTSNHLTYITPSVGALSNPRNLSIDATDATKLWVTDTGSNSVIEMTTSGTVLATFNGSSTFPLVLTSPFGNANDAANVYVADTYDHRIVAVAKSDGHTVWSQSTCAAATPAALTRVRDVAIGSDGNIYAVDTDANRVVVFNTSGTCLSSWTGSAAGFLLKAPRALVSDGAGGVWIVVDGSAPALLHYSNNGGTLFGKSTNAGGFLAPEGVYLDGGKVVVADPFAFQVVTFTVTGGVPSATGVAFNQGGPVLGGFNNPFGVAYAPNGDLFVTDMFNQRIEKYSAGTGTWIASGHFGGGAGNVQNPRGLSVSPDGLTLIVTNSEDERIDLFNTSDLSFKQSIVPTCGKLFFPHQTAFDPISNSYWIADTNNHRVVQVNSSGTCLQNWTAGGVLKTPRGIAWDGTNVWVADTQAAVVYRCTISGTCTAVAKRTGTPTIVSGPWNMTIANGDLYMADESAGKIVVMDLSGAPVFTFGNPGGNPNLGQFSSPRSVAINPVDGSVAVADFNANLISIWQ